MKSKRIPPQPDPEYLAMSRELQYRQECRTPHTPYPRGLSTRMKRRFMAAFGLKPRPRQPLAYEIYCFVREKFPIVGSHPFDHIDLFQRNGRFVIVSQPYDFKESKLAEGAGGRGIIYTVAGEWSYHYPGHTSLFFVEFGTMVMAEFAQYSREKRLARKRERRRRKRGW